MREPDAPEAPTSGASRSLPEGTPVTNDDAARLLQAITDPVGYWEERAARAENTLAVVRARLGALPPPSPSRTTSPPPWPTSQTSSPSPPLAHSSRIVSPLHMQPMQHMQRPDLRLSLGRAPDLGPNLP